MQVAGQLFPVFGVFFKTIPQMGGQDLDQMRFKADMEQLRGRIKRKVVVTATSLSAGTALQTT